VTNSDVLTCFDFLFDSRNIEFDYKHLHKHRDYQSGYWFWLKPIEIFDGELGGVYGAESGYRVYINSPHLPSPSSGLTSNIDILY
jgi:hypothetical protein